MSRSEKITFENDRGVELAAKMDWPDGDVRHYGVFAHCFTCSKDTAAASRISRALTDHGIAVLRFDFTGLGSSDGDFANTNFSSNVQDLLAACDFVKARYGSGPAFLIGHSLGGAAVLAAAYHIESLKAVVTIAAPGDVAHVQHFLAQDRETIEREGEAEVELAGRSFRIKRQFLEDIQEAEIADAIGRMRAALLLFHSPQDATVSVEHARLIYEKAKHPKSFVSLDGADHLLSSKSDSQYVADVIAAWATRYVGGPPTAASPDVEAGDVLVRSIPGRAFTQDVFTRTHHLLGDEPRDAGGDDRGPNPYELLLSSLGTCTAMTLRMYADHKGLALSGVQVRLSHARVHAEDCEDCETKDGKVDEIQRVVSLEGDLGEAERARLLEIADRCPVHRTLENEIRVRTRLDK